jgi:hypothetical protein
MRRAAGVRYPRKVAVLAVADTEVPDRSLTVFATVTV